MSKSIKSSNTGRFTKVVDKKNKFRKILEKYGIPSSRLGGFEYIVATNLMILEQLKKITPEKKDDANFSMLDF